ncbi:MAG: hypothetical protein J1E34_07325 [Oscillospiraceae bacterium]|nr:hypothetical protein [Oscillospiraceae bacterium]
MTAVKRFFYQHRIFFGLFAFILIYETVVGNNCSPWLVNDHFFVFYVVDFSMGFCSRILPGAIYRLLFNEATTRAVSVYASVLLIVFFAGVCVFLEKLVLHTSKENKMLCLFFVLLFITGPASFSLFVSWLGVIDFYWVLLTLLFFVFLSKKQLYILIPFLFSLCIFVHYGAMVSYIPMMAIIILYKISVSGEKGEKKLLWAVFSLSVIFAFVTTLYFMLFERQNLVYDMQEFDSLILERGAKYTYYYDYEFYKSISAQMGVSADDYIFSDGNLIMRLLKLVQTQFESTFNRDFKIGSMQELAFAGLVLVPVAGVIFSAIFEKVFKSGEKNAVKKFSLSLVPLLFLLTLVFGTLFSTDTFRWLSHTLLPLFTVFLYVAYYEGDSIFNGIRRKLNFLPVPAAALFFILYASCAPTL